MARTKNRGTNNAVSPTLKIMQWRLGEYIRLSKEDLNRGRDESNSVVNQKRLLDDYYNRHIDEFESAAQYIETCDIIEPPQETASNQGFRELVLFFYITRWAASASR